MKESENITPEDKRAIGGYKSYEELIPNEIMFEIEKTFDLNSSKLPSKEILKKHIKASFFDLTDEEKRDHIKYIMPMVIRDSYLENAFVAYTDEMLSALKAFVDKRGIKKIHELCCGTGWFSHWMRKYGINVETAVDNKSWAHYKALNNFLEIVKKEDAIRFVRKNPDADMFVLSWPYMDPTARNIWDSMRPGQLLLYIGENYGGCTADEHFFVAIQGHEINDDDMFEKIKDGFVQFRGINDEPRLFKK